MTLRLTGTRLLMAAAVACSVSACAKHDPRAATPENFAHALDQTLARHGDICVAMFDWPVDLTEAEAGAGSRHAVQLPVLEKLGLVQGTIVAVPRSHENPDGALKRFTLTDAGRQFYKPHAYISRDGEQHPNDFCVAHLTREKIMDIQLDRRDAQHPQAVVSYTYRIDAAPWMKDADAQRVFPMIEMVIRGANGGLQMHQGFTLGDQGWVARTGPV